MTMREVTSEPSTRATYRDQVKAFIVPVVGAAVQDDEDLFGLKDSLFAMELLVFVEGTFGIRIQPEDLSIENFRSVNAICALIERRVG
jgi:methoxymalonate biosynthesis acyl carrier protein